MGLHKLGYKFSNRTPSFHRKLLLRVLLRFCNCCVLLLKIEVLFLNKDNIRKYIVKSFRETNFIPDANEDMLTIFSCFLIKYSKVVFVRTSLGPVSPVNQFS